MASESLDELNVQLFWFCSLSTCRLPGYLGYHTKAWLTGVLFYFLSGIFLPFSTIQSEGYDLNLRVHITGWPQQAQQHAEEARNIMLRVVQSGPQPEERQHIYRYLVYQLLYIIYFTL